ncbi:MAG: amidohydrolase family protein [Clostridiaceae bacterium]|jgi:imidazolonepropionase-like amidohydrolase|nr:amidohydrolase family protein [Clostridiaceae bacterium]
MNKNAFVIKAEGIYDGTRTAMRRGMAVAVKDGVIEAIVPSSAVASFEEKGYLILDEKGKYVIPGLIDAHVHLVLPGDGTAAEDALSRPISVTAQTVRENCAQALSHGITTLRDCGGLADVLFYVRDEIRRGEINGPNLILSGAPLTSPKGHTWYFGGEVRTPKEAREKVQEQIKAGADFVKLIATGGGTRGVVQSDQMLTNEEMAAASEEAEKEETYATAHVCTTVTARAAVESGVHMLEHLILADASNTLAFDELLIEQIANKKIPVAHTMSVLKLSIAKYTTLGRALTEQEQAEYDMLRRFDETIDEGFRRTCKDLVYIPATDSGWRSSSFGSLADSMIPMERLGLSIPGVLYSATGLAADVLRREDIGILSEGRRADIAVLDADPFEDLDNLKKVSLVFKDGKEVFRA